MRWNSYGKGRYNPFNVSQMHTKTELNSNAKKRWK